jgi:hypothetical protein
VVLTAALQRVARKYQAHAYRLVHLDAGRAIAQVRLVADALGLRVAPSLSWDDEQIGATARH